MNEATAHALLRDRRHWHGTLAGLAIDHDGALQLARVPAPADGKAIDLGGSYPYSREVSGLALGPCEAVFVADTAHHRVRFVDGLCGSSAWLPHRVLPLIDAPGHFHTPRGLALTNDALLVADSGHHRLQSLALPGLEAHIAWPQDAGSIAVDGQGRLLWVDPVAPRVHRRQVHGAADTAFDATLQSRLLTPLFVAAGAEDRVLVSDATANQVLVFDAAGALVQALPGPAGWLPGALATHGSRCYVADAASGQIHVFDGSTYIGAVNGWRGPVTALAVHEKGDLFVKPGLDAAYHRLKADAAFVPLGELVAGPFDAGEDRVWERAWVEAETAATTGARLSVATQQAAPTAGDWQALPSADALLAPLGAARFIWLRLQLASAAATASPRVTQARCATAAENLLDFLPQTYARHDTSGFLERWLKLLRGEYGRVEELLDDMPRLADPSFEPASELPWLAQWLALELPRVADDDERRALLKRAFALFARRGSKASIAEFCELHTGVRPALVEAFAERHIWALGVSSRLDFDTRLAPLDPNGWVLPDEAAGAGRCPPQQSGPAVCSPCGDIAPQALPALAAGPIGRAIVGDGGPLGEAQIGLPLYADAAYRFCVVVDAYRVHDPALRAELQRIVEREKPAHTDYRIETVEADMRIGLQARIGVDTLVGGDAPPWRADLASLGLDTQLPPSDTARFGDAVLDGTLTLL
jgi:phage tail-like protein